MTKLKYSLVLFPNSSPETLELLFQVHYMEQQAIGCDMFTAANGWRIYSASRPELSVTSKKIYLHGDAELESNLAAFRTRFRMDLLSARDLVRQIHIALREWTDLAPCFSTNVPPPVSPEVTESLLFAEEEIATEVDDEQDAEPYVDEFNPPVITL